MMKVDFRSPEHTPAVHRHGFVKRKYHLAWAARDALRVFPRVNDIYAIAARNRLPDDLREEIMVAVSRANGCTICNFTHHEFAQQAGVSLERLRQLEQADYRGYDPRSKLAIDFAVARSLSDFGPVDPALEASFRETYSEQEQYDIDFVSRFITIMNLSCNKLEALVSRFSGQPAQNSSLFGELVLSGIAMSIIPAMYGLVALSRKERFGQVVQEFFEFARHYEKVVDPVLPESGQEHALA